MIMSNRRLCDIGREITTEWSRPYFGAQPYLHAMERLEHMGDMYGQDSAESVVLYFLSNATTWRGDAARRIKGELKTMLKEAKR